MYHDVEIDSRSMASEKKTAEKSTNRNIADREIDQRYENHGHIGIHKSLSPFQRGSPGLPSRPDSLSKGYINWMKDLTA